MNIKYGSIPRTTGGGNPEHLFIATQDRALRGRLMAQPGCAAVFASVNGLHLEAPSVAQKAEARAAEAQHLSVGRHELMVRCCGDSPAMEQR